MKGNSQRLIQTIIIGMIVLSLSTFPNKIAAEKMKFYIDGQAVQYFGEVTKDKNEWYVPLIPVLQHAVEKHQEEITAAAGRELYGVERLDYAAEHFFPALHVKEVNGRKTLPIGDAKKLGYDVGLYVEHGLLHFSSEQLMEVEGISIGMDFEEVKRIIPSIHWNTAFGQAADFYGFYGERLPFSYTDRYGIERTEDASALQIEITNGKVSHIIVSSARYPTSYGIKVGDRLFDATLAYGSKSIRAIFEGKQVVIYDVERGSIWFIANDDGIIERIAFWDHWLAGFISHDEEARK